ncbi:uncharacterized protein LOC111694907 isoform X2 [Eurytemora carolleeae]|uniref:uncharacterized protein LOC111694907 isoform X2 n=1 Tax=Eurytemora carolleeae TaxID=1294199 RepID=UPI000C78FC59|nr:uncharacterized protein LOC111694907 isoform X2 [Eurytemora carolleeae]|eukprot:XP_023319732.1 uncharacterized protein LOC111694907 isoform X2 [Eurytemora affinis]
MFVFWLGLILFPVINSGKKGVEFFSGKAVRPVLTRLEKYEERREKLQSEIKEVGGLPGKGNNLRKQIKASKPALDILKQEGDRGIVLQVENFSGRFLADPRVWTRCGYQYSQFPVFSTLAPAAVDIAILHNNKEMRSSCGSISWQVMVHPGKPLKLQDGKGLRLFVTWSNLDTVGSNRCKDGKLNEFMIGFKKVELDNTGHWDPNDEGSFKNLYKNYHTKDLLDQYTFEQSRSILKNKTVPSLGSIVESPDSQLEVYGEMESGCITSLTLQILGRRAGKLADTDLGLKESRVPDEVWEQMIRQAWLDIVVAVNRDRALYGIGLEPLYVDPLMDQPVYVNTSLLGYEIEFYMWNITIAGLADMKLEELVLERGDSLKNLDTRAVLNIGNLTVTGQYKYKAVYTGWVWGMGDMDSGGEQAFTVDLGSAKQKIEVSMDVVDGCNKTSNLVITNIQLPLEYDYVNFDFKNIGSILGGVVSVIGEMAIELSKSTIVDLVKSSLKEEVGTLLCDLDRKPTPMERVPVFVEQVKDPAWHSVLENATRGWGIHTLRRDILAEQFITKVFNDGVARHLADPNDPIVKLLDPFQLLPVSEDFRKPGLLKGHVVVCEMWLYDLSKLKLLDMQLARNEDLTYSALKIKLGLPTTRTAGKYRLNNVRVMSALPAPTSEGTVEISLTGVTVDLTVVLRAKPVKNQGNASIAMETFEVEFGSDDVKFNITGLAKGLNTIANKVSNALGNDILEMQKSLLNKEIKNILYGFADCLMYKPAMGLQTCMDKFWESLGFKIPFEFPACQELYRQADKEMGLV